jgi:hypothetical protein
VRVRCGLIAVVGVLSLRLAALAPGANVATPQECHYACDGCLQVVYDLDCAESAFRSALMKWSIAMVLSLGVASNNFHARDCL